MTVLVTVFCLAGCSASDNTVYDGTWLNTNLAGTYAKKKPSLKDDFYQAVNYKWLKAHKSISEEDRMASLSWGTGDGPQQQIRDMLREETSLSGEEALCKTFYSQITDRKARNALGMKAALDIIRQFQAVTSYDEFWATGVSDTLPYCLPFSFMFYVDSNDSSTYISSVVPTVLSGIDPEKTQDEEVLKDRDAFVTCMKCLLVKCGWEEAAAEADIEKALRFENQISGIQGWTAADYDRDRFSAVFPNLPVFSVYEAKGGTKTSLRVNNEEFMKNLNACCTEENLEAMKTWAILRFLVQYAVYFDDESVDAFYDMAKELTDSTVSVTDEDRDFAALELQLSEPLSQAWYKRYVSDETVAEVTELTKDIISHYEKRFDDADWISEKTRLGAFDKLNDLKFFIGHAVMNDWSSFELVSSEEEGALLKNAIRLTRQVEAFTFDMAMKPNAQDRWQALPSEVNACYMSQDNSINIYAGIINAQYKSDWPVEKKLGSLGMVIAHEITHVFDINGSRWDKNGNHSDWWDYLDLAELNQKSVHLTGIAASKDLVRSRMGDASYQGEVTADAGAMAVMLDIAEQYPDFDYDLFFRSYAENWCMVKTGKNMDDTIETDVHPLPFVRVNFILQLYDRFYETYDIQEGDGMYLPPDKRFKVW